MTNNSTRQALRCFDWWDLSSCIGLTAKIGDVGGKQAQDRKAQNHDKVALSALANIEAARVARAITKIEVIPRGKTEQKRTRREPDSLCLSHPIHRCIGYRHSFEQDVLSKHWRSDGKIGSAAGRSRTIGTSRLDRCANLWPAIEAANLFPPFDEHCGEYTMQLGQTLSSGS